MPSLPTLARAALARPADAPALCFEERWLGWGDLNAIAGAVQQALAAAGVSEAAPVAFIPRNRPPSIAALLAFLAQGRSVRMIYSFQAAERIAASLEPGAVSALVLHAEDLAPEIESRAAALGLALVVLGPAGAVRLHGPARADKASPDRLGPYKAGDPRIDILTSGTTGPPKHFPVPYSLIERHFVSTPLTRAQGDDPAAAPPFLLYFPLGNITGLYSTLPTLLRGQRAVLLERFTLEGWLAHVRTYRPAHTGVPPSAVRQILDAQVPAADLASIRAMGVGAAPLDPGVHARFEAAYGIPILPSYGATEFAGPVAMMTAELHAAWGAAKRGSVGHPLPGVSLRVIDEATGAVLPAGEIGLLQVIAPRIGADWITTSDLALIDGDGFVYLKGRADGAIMRGGFKVLPEAIEAALLLHPAVAEAAVTGIPDLRVGQVPAAAVCAAPGAGPLDPDDLESHLRRHVLATHIPARWLVCAELPRTASLKVDRPALKALFSGDLKGGEG